MASARIDAPDSSIHHVIEPDYLRVDLKNTLLARANLCEQLDPSRLRSVYHSAGDCIQNVCSLLYSFHMIDLWIEV